MLSYEESLLLRRIKKIRQDLIAIKTPQRYLTGQTKGYTSNTLRLNSQIAFTRGGYEWREIFAELLFTGDRIEKTVVPDLRVQLYNSSGTPITYGAGFGNYSVNYLYGMNRAGSSANQQEFLINFYIVGDSGTTNAFYGDFWCVANDSGILSLKATHITP